MQLTVRDVGKYLGVPESTITRWIKQKGLPAQYIGGQYHFNRAELLEWATTHQIKVSVELFEQADREAEPPPSLADALEVGGIHYQVPDSNKDRALQALVQLLPLPEGIDRDLLLHLFRAREAAASTGIGDGIAIPHVRNPIVLNVTRPMVTLCFLEKAIDFGALDHQPVYVLFSLICPTTRTHLQLISRLSFILHDPKFRDVVKRQGPREEILQEVRRVEAGLAASASAGGVGR